MTKRKQRKPKEAKSRVPYTPERVLTDWRALISAIPHMTEDEVKACLDKELEECNRQDFTKRLYGRYSSLRRKRELAEQKEITSGHGEIGSVNKEAAESTEETR